jgi:hypothetical protein
MSASPLQAVAKSFGDRAKLVDQLAGMVDKLNGDTTTDDVKSRLSGLSNKKLLRLYKVEQTVRERFGDREKLVQHILAARKKAGFTTDENYKAKLAFFSKARLLDLTKQQLPEAPKKQTPEERMKSKRGRKQRERAQSKLRG